MTDVPELDDQGRNLLVLLVSKLSKSVPNEPHTFASYKDIHDELGLPKLRETWGESLQAQGLDSLGEWTAKTGKPGITGIIIDRRSMMPGDGYFRLYGRKSDDFEWWKDEIKRSKLFDWSPYVQGAVPPVPPTAIDFVVPPDRQETTTYRIIRDSLLARRVKLLHNYECQLCGHTIELPDGSRYAEAHHMRPLGDPHSGPDILENIICLCPNHHAELDYGACAVDALQIKNIPGHNIDGRFISYHNSTIWRQSSKPTTF
jgi:hypothetical protein